MLERTKEQRRAFLKRANQLRKENGSVSFCDSTIVFEGGPWKGKKFVESSMSYSLAEDSHVFEETFLPWKKVLQLIKSGAYT
jgi:hypothetical protein